MKHAPVIIERVVTAPVEQVWKSITDPNDMKQWYFDIPSFKAEAGYQFSFIGKDHDGKEWVHLCTVLEVIPNKKFSHTWRYEGYEGESIVTWELTPEGKSTRVKLTHENLESFPPLKSLAKENFVQGWTEIVSRLLPEYLAKQE